MKLLNEHKAGTAHNMKKIWSVYSFILWYEKYFIAVSYTHLDVYKRQLGYVMPDEKVYYDITPGN